jgi:predicted AAA+ superfamily ATPase
MQYTAFCTTFKPTDGIHWVVIKRSVAPFLIEFLNKKIVLLAGPRQVGKTFLSRSLFKKIEYLNFDVSEDRAIIQSKTWNRERELLVLDEVHKMKGWKRWAKGIYDTEGVRPKILITGSSRLDTSKKVGDSLAGRHFMVRLNPFSLNELTTSPSLKTIDDMLLLGTFPEPLLSGSERQARLWRKSHLDVILKQDLIELEQVRDIKSIELLVDLLSERVGSGISYAHLAQNLNVSPHTVKRWIEHLENMFVIFSVYPYVKNVAKAIKKEPKIYFYDLGRVKSGDGGKLENLVALHLLKRNQFIEDTEGRTLRLCYIRDQNRHEIDFVIEDERILTHLIEVKSSDDAFNTSLNYFSGSLKPQKALQVVKNLKREKHYDTHKIVGLIDFLTSLET